MEEGQAASGQIRLILWGQYVSEAKRPEVSSFYHPWGLASDGTPVDPLLAPQGHVLTLEVVFWFSQSAHRKLYLFARADLSQALSGRFLARPTSAFLSAAPWL